MAHVPTSSLVQPHYILPGSGEMAGRIRARDWSATPLGPLAEWPQSLRTAVGICVESRFPMAIWWGSSVTQIYNDAYAVILGAKHPRSLGQSGKECWAEIWPVLEPLYVEVMEHGRSTWSDDLLLMMDRFGYLEETYFTFSYSPIREESGGVGGLLITCAETTERVIGERRLRTLRDLGECAGEARRVRDACSMTMAILARNPIDVPAAALYLVDAAGDAVTLAGVAGWARTRSQVRERIELTGAPVSEVLSGALAGGTAEVEVLPVGAGTQASPGGYLVVAASSHRRLDDGYRGFFQLLAGYVDSAISNARAYEDAERRADALAELDRVKTAFFGNVSHEFRTPLTLLLGPLDDALSDADEPLGPGQRERLQVAHRNSLRLLKLVNTLLDFTRLEAGRTEASFEPTDLSAFTAELASGFRSAAERAGLGFRIHCPPLPDPVYVDHDMWEKIVLNLLSNAFKFTLEGEIEVNVRAEPGAVRVSVRDTGAGIAPEDVPRIFERFHRVREVRGRTLEGTGIGLALVQELVKLHGGRIEVTSTPGLGSTFAVVLPVGRSHLPEALVGGPPVRPGGALGAAPYIVEALRWTPAPSAPATVGASERPAARIVVADDNADMREYVLRLLGGGYRVEAFNDGQRALESVLLDPPALVLSDVMMPGLDGFGLLAAMRADPRTRMVPVILLSARAGEESRVEGLEAGADDYLVKPFSARELLARVESTLNLACVRREAEAALRAGEERYRAFIELTSEAVWRLELDEPMDVTQPMERQIDLLYEHGYLAECNDAMARMHGFSAAAELVGSRLRQLLPRDQRANLTYLRGFIASGYRLTNAETDETGQDGHLRHFVNNLYGVVRGGQLLRVWGTQLDVTERRLTEARLQQAQRMETVGKLAGGIAHEVNNMMSVVLGCSEFVLRRGDLAPAVRADVEQVREAAQRSAAITTQLLAFSRRQVLQPVPLDLTVVVRDIEPVLRRTLGEGVELVLHLVPTGLVRADRGQLQQVLLNLTLNARDAMPRGGRLRIETAVAELTDRDAAEHSEVRLRRGPHALLLVSDTGHGMDRETASHVFEPFFTTKDVGRGTGLGLSTVYGIVKQSEGYIWADSEPGQGSTFRIYLPLSDVPAPATERIQPVVAAGSETILVVEDEAMVRAMTVRALTDEGYAVLEAMDGAGALDQLSRHGDRVHLVLADVAMEGMSGLELAERVAARRPDLPVLFMSGYPVDEVMSRGLLGGHQPFLQKPFAPATLAARVRTLLDAADGRVQE